MAAMLGGFSEARTWASRVKRASRSASSANGSGSTLRATSRFSLRSRARDRSPMPPAPSGATISYGPRRRRADRAMGSGGRECAHSSAGAGSPLSRIGSAPSAVIQLFAETADRVYRSRGHRPTRQTRAGNFRRRLSGCGAFPLTGARLYEFVDLVLQIPDVKNKSQDPGWVVLTLEAPTPRKHRSDLGREMFDNHPPNSEARTIFRTAVNTESSTTTMTLDCLSADTVADSRAFMALRPSDS